MIYCYRFYGLSNLNWSVLMDKMLKRFNMEDYEIIFHIIWCMSLLENVLLDTRSESHR